MWLPLLHAMLASLSKAEAAEAERGEGEEAEGGEGSSPQPEGGRAGVRQASLMRRLSDLLPMGLRDYDLSRLLGSDSSRAGSVLEREAISAEIVQALICGLAQTRAYGFVVDGAEQLSTLAWRLLHMVVHAVSLLASSHHPPPLLGTMTP